MKLIYLAEFADLPTKFQRAFSTREEAEEYAHYLAESIATQGLNGGKEWGVRAIPLDAEYGNDL